MYSLSPSSQSVGRGMTNGSRSAPAEKSNRRSFEFSPMPSSSTRRSRPFGDNNGVAEKTLRGVFQACRCSPVVGFQTRTLSPLQETSEPPSAEKDCSIRADFGEIFNQT